MSPLTTLADLEETERLLLARRLALEVYRHGDPECGPLPISVAYSGTNGNCFVTMGQLGINQAIDCNQYGGWWMPIYDPKLPSTKKQNANRTKPCTER